MSQPSSDEVSTQPLSFDALSLSPKMLAALAHVGYLEPTPVQAGFIPEALAGKDVMAQARTGTGKTAAYAIPLLETIRLRREDRSPRALILVPTRELAVQVTDEIDKLAHGRKIATVALYGGKPIRSQITKLQRGAEIIVGTPGRVLDHLSRKTLDLRELAWVVLDEADRMLDIGFRPDIEKILSRCPKQRQTVLLSATVPPPVERLAHRYMHEPLVLNFSPLNPAADTIDQYYFTVDQEKKFPLLLRLLEREKPEQAIVFCRTKRETDRVYNRLRRKLNDVDCIHGDMPQQGRDSVMRRFRDGLVRTLVATDVVGRGIDVSGISHIINYDVPQSSDDYVHRVGRTGRMGREGVAYTFVTTEEGPELTRIEMLINRLLKREELSDFEAFERPTAEVVDEAEPEPKKPQETPPGAAAPTAPSTGTVAWGPRQRPEHSRVMADENQPAKRRPRSRDFVNREGPAREKYPAIPLPQRRRGWRPEIANMTPHRPGWVWRLVIGFLWSLTLLMATGVALRLFFHDRWIPLVWWNSFTLYVYLPVYLSLAVALVARRWRLAALAAVVAICHWAWIVPDFLPPELLDFARGGPQGGENRPSGGGLRLYYQNLNMHAEDFQPRIDTILEEDPDVIALVEFYPPWEAAVKKSAIFTKYPHHTLRPNPALSQQLAIFSKLPLEGIEHRFILGRRLAVAATVRLGGQPVRIFCIHAPRPLVEQAEQYRDYFRDIIAWIGQSPGPLVVAGDFNSTQHAASYQRLASQAHLHSAHRDVGRGYAVTWPNGRYPSPPIRIDHVLLSPELLCQNVREGDGGLSDHKPLICDLVLASGGTDKENGKPGD